MLLGWASEALDLFLKEGAEGLEEGLWALRSLALYSS